MTRDEVREIVREVLTALGFDVRDPTSVQADLRLLREWRLTARAARRHVVLAVVGVFVSALVALVWMGVRAFLGK